MLLGGNAGHGESQRFGNTSQYRNVGLTQLVAQIGRKILHMKKNEDQNNTLNNHTVSLRNTLNELTGAEWLYFTKSVLTTAYPSEYGHELRKAHGANKPPQLMCQLIEFFTRPQGRVLDPFAGVGGTLIGSVHLRLLPSDATFRIIFVMPSTSFFPGE